MLKFVLAQLKGDVCLVQVSDSSLSSALMVSDVKVFRHEFITIFRYSHTVCVHPADLRVLCTIDDRCALHDEEKETVYLTKDVMHQLQKLMAAAPSRHGTVVRRSRVASTTRTGHNVVRAPSGAVPLSKQHMPFIGR